MVVSLSALSTRSKLHLRGHEKRNPSGSKSPRPVLRPDGDEMGMGVRHALFPVLALGAHWLPASRRYSPRQAESSAS